ncbi:MAG: DNA repair protein RadC [Epsilonproteobacteria bacterium]|nr:MAG: DNA repair protein RadC [Campylobacterota bacterium]
MKNKIKTEDQPIYQNNAELLPEIEREEIVLRQARLILAKRLKQHDFKASDGNLVKEYLMLNIVEKEREVFGCLFLNNQHRLIKDEILFRGTIDGASVYPREVVKDALMCNAAAVIFYHNHPSGLDEPSQADKHITERLKKALATVDIRALDHFIVAGMETYSFAEHGLI